jgi:sortase A
MEAAMRKNIKLLIGILIIIGGIAVMSYSSFANYINQKNTFDKIVQYDDKIAAMKQEELDANMQMAYAYNASLPVDFPANPLLNSNIRDFSGTKFEKFFMVQPDAMIGYVEAPDINVYLPIYYGTSEKVLNEGSGLVDNTSLPVGGAGTHAVISAHTGMASRKLFTDLDKMEKGNIFFVHVLDQHFAYQVDQIKVVLPTETDDLKIEKGQDYVTLLTCTPFGINDHRLLVRGKRIPYDFNQKKGSAALRAKQYKNTILWMIILGIAALTVMVIGFVKFRRKRKKRK